MRIIIVGCGRVGAQTAAELDQRGEHVTVIDIDQRAFNRLPSTFGGVTVRGSGGDEDIQRGAGAEMCDLLMALTEGDNRNAMAAQLGKHVFGIPRVIAKINDPVRAEAYRSLGLETICRTVILADALSRAADRRRRVDRRAGAAAHRRADARRPGGRHRRPPKRSRGGDAEPKPEAEHRRRRGGAS